MTISLTSADAQNLESCFLRMIKAFFGFFSNKVRTRMIGCKKIITSYLVLNWCIMCKHSSQSQSNLSTFHCGFAANCGNKPSAIFGISWYYPKCCKIVVLQLLYGHPFKEKVRKTNGAMLLWPFYEEFILRGIKEVYILSLLSICF